MHGAQSCADISSPPHDTASTPLLPVVCVAPLAPEGVGSIEHPLVTIVGSGWSILSVAFAAGTSSVSSMRFN